jgi:beta-galactosidase/beta-glucuronidase
MSWKEKLKKIKTAAQASKEKQKEEASALASRVSYWIEKAEDLAKEFAQVSKAKVKLFNLRHKEIDELTGKKYYTGGVTLEITRQKSSLLNWIKSDEPAEKLIAQIEFPHPEAIKRLEGYEDKIKIIYSNSEKEIPFKEFSLELLKTHLEEAYSCYLSKRKK